MSTFNESEKIQENPRKIQDNPRNIQDINSENPRNIQEKSLDNSSILSDNPRKSLDNPRPIQDQSKINQEKTEKRKVNPKSLENLKKRHPKQEVPTIGIPQTSNKTALYLGIAVGVIVSSIGLWQVIKWLKTRNQEPQPVNLEDLTDEELQELANMEENVVY